MVHLLEDFDLSDDASLSLDVYQLVLIIYLDCNCLSCVSVVGLFDYRIGALS